MYQKGDYINYGGHGVCRIEDITSMNFGGGAGKSYYVIQPIAPGSATIYFPVDSPKAVERMRPLLSKEEIDAIILSVKDEQMTWIADRKQRTAQFQQILSRRDERELLLLASCLHQRQMEKPLPSSEMDMLRRVEHIIEQEFAFTLDLHAQQIGEYIREKLSQCK